jgi:hypothetical protein
MHYPSMGEQTLCHIGMVVTVGSLRKRWDKTGVERMA